MEIIGREDLYKHFENEEVISNKEINIKYLDLKDITTVRFENCNFSQSQINFDNSKRQNDSPNNKVNITFQDCEFNNLAIMGIKNIGIFSFYNIKKAKSIKITNCEFDSLISENNVDIDYKIEINFSIFLDYFNFSNNVFNENGSINFRHNTFLKSAIINDNLFNDLTFFEQFFKDFLLFKNTFFTNSNSSLTQCEFKKALFSKSNFSTFSFNNCDFLDTTWFEECKNLNNSKLKFGACKFEKYSLFDNSKFNKLEISHSKFLEKASFENFETNYFKIHQVTFMGAAYFDDLNKNNNDVIENWDRKTLRAIKRELVNTHNQIDYLRFKAYELNAFKKEVDQDKLNWKDSLILYFNEDSNFFGLDWTKGISFIFQWSFIFYLLYIISYSACSNDLNCIPEIGNFFVNYLKFINPFSFLKPPFEDTENYFFPFFFFILGKIFVSYGIYQTVQAFRKFGVNGG